MFVRWLYWFCIEFFWTCNLINPNLASRISWCELESFLKNKWQTVHYIVQVSITRFQVICLDNNVSHVNIISYKFWSCKYFNTWYSDLNNDTCHMEFQTTQKHKLQPKLKLLCISMLMAWGNNRMNKNKKYHLALRTCTVVLKIVSQNTPQQKHF